MKGLYVNIFRDTYKCELNAMNGLDQILLVDSKMDGIYEPKKDELYLMLVRRDIYPNEPKFIHAVLYKNGQPYSPNGKHCCMFGGSFVYSSDSRFSRLNHYPIQVHDRFE